ncbi:MAG: hypothetical protein K0R39_897 [Symbiobacteriaceae bacterium]|jgi:hypothetical protein|nr:hypothetical protein [Symbiobacteriaceae bacterium]
MKPARPDGTEPQQPAKTRIPENMTKAHNEAVAKMEALMEQVKLTGRPVIKDLSQGIMNTKGVKEILKGNARPSYITIEGPAFGRINKLGDRRLAKTVEMLGRKVKWVYKVRAMIQKGTQTVFVWEAEENDPQGIDVKRSGNYATINLDELMISEQMQVQSGHYEKYKLEFSEPDDLVYPALKFDMSQKVESGLTSEEKLRRAEVAGLVPPKAERTRAKKSAGTQPTPGTEAKVQAPEAQGATAEETE